MSFDAFWNVYPRKVGKKNAQRLWEKMKLDSKTADIVHAVVEQSKDWDDIKYVKHPSTWLYGEHWCDELNNDVSAKVLFLKSVKK